MLDQEVMLTAIVFGSVVGIVFLILVSTIIKAWIKRDSSSNVIENKEFIAALREFKENTEQRISNLETIIADEERSTARSRDPFTKSVDHEKTLNIELEELSDEEIKRDKGNLRNMLNQ